MKNTLKKHINIYALYIRKPWALFALASILGALFFVSFYGYHVINPLNTGWLTAGGDLKQNYLGWVFYRNSPWEFPIGMIKNLAFPYGLPVTYTDSIPLLAVPLKLLSNILPANFQYFGVWGLVCYMLQGGISALILRHYTRNAYFVLLG